MKYFIHLIVAAALLTCLTSCGHKGRLKTPSQIEVEEQKKARKEAKKAEKAKEAAEKNKQVEQSNDAVK